MKNVRSEQEIRDAINELEKCEQVLGPSVECLRCYGAAEALKWVLTEESELPEDLRYVKDLWQKYGKVG